MIKGKITRWLSFFAVLFFAGRAFAAQPDLAAAKSLIQQGKSADAYLLLEPFEFDQAGNVEYDYLLGTAALNSGMPGKATLVFERVLAVEPKYVGVRADMARAYFEMGDFARAKIEFETILVLQNLPPGIREQAQKYMTALQNGTGGRTNFTGYIDAGFGHDSNVNSATKQSPILFTAYGILYFPDPAALPKSDTYAALNLGGELNHKLGEKLSAYGGLDIRGRSYTKYSDANYKMLDGRAGLSYSGGEHLLRTGLIRGRFFAAGQASRDTAGWTGEWRYALDSSNQLSMNGRYARYRFVNVAQSSEDYNDSTLGLGWVHAFGGGKSMLMANVDTGSEHDVNGRADGRKRYNSLRLTGQSALTDTAGFFISVGATHGNFDKLNPNFLVVRQDKLYDATVGTNFQIYKSWALRPQLSYIKSTSNIPFYKFDKTDFSLNVRRDF